jgi:hypothetical protein
MIFSSDQVHRFNGYRQFVAEPNYDPQRGTRLALSISRSAGSKWIGGIRAPQA